jgi:hypothetical protein
MTNETETEARVIPLDGEPRRIVKGIEQLGSLLVPDEKVQTYAVQRRLFVLINRRSIVAATTGRFIGMRRGILGGFYPLDVRWQDLKDVRLSVGIFGATLTLVAFSGPDLAVAGQTRMIQFGGLRKDEAQAVYRLCQAQEQAWREKRRVRELEELRAKSGGIHLGSSAVTGVPAGSSEDPTTRLERAKQMLEKGLITDSEYESIKAKILSSL